MSNSFTIASVNDGTRLTFGYVSGESFSAALENPAFSGRVAASAYVNGPPSLLFTEMAAEWRGWQGAKGWAALDDDLRLSASTDRTGHIALEVVLQAPGGAADWRLEATLHLEASQLEALARAVNRVFAQVPPT